MPSFSFAFLGVFESSWLVEKTPLGHEDVKKHQAAKPMKKPPSILEMNAFDMKQAAALEPAVRDMVERRQRLFGTGSPLFYDEPIHFVRAQGVWMYAADGTPYLDVYNNVPSVGHCHPYVVEAVARQLAMLNTHTRYLFDDIYIYAERLLATFPPEISNVVFTCTGSESSDLALRIARNFTGGEGVVVTENAYHGNTSAVSEISPASGPGVPLGRHVRDGGGARRLSPADRAIPGARFAEDVQGAIQDLKRHGVRFSALIVDTIFSSDGVFADPPGFLAQAAAVAREAGGLFIADEVQPGFGRTGDAMWGFERHGIVPDLVVMGKPMGNGIPVAAVAARPEVLGDFARSSGYFNTFGGSPVAAAAGLAVLEVLEREQLVANARRVGEYLRTGLRQLAAEFGRVGDVRGAGLFTGMELSEENPPRIPRPDWRASWSMACAGETSSSERRAGTEMSSRYALHSVFRKRTPTCSSAT